MKTFALYTLARLGLFLASYGVIWLVFGRWLTWDSLTALYTALIAMAISAGLSLVLLRDLRARLSAEVTARAERAQLAHQARLHAEDDD